MKKYLLVFLSLGCSAAMAQQKTTQQKSTAPAAKVQTTANVKNVTVATHTDNHAGAAHQEPRRKKTVVVREVKPGLRAYIWHFDDSKLPKIVEGDQLSVRVRLYAQDGKTMLNDFGFIPNIPVQRQNFAFMYEGILQATPEDSILLTVSSDSMFHQQMPPFTKSGEQICYSFQTYTKEQADVEQKKAQAQKEMKQKQQTAADENRIRGYFAAMNITQFERTPEGLYYTIQQQGNGEMAKQGDQIVVNYTGKLLDGTKFDSNVDTAFHHTQPFSFKLGQHQVIPGWDIGYTKISKGTKATFYIPSTLAYGEQAPPGGKIKPNDVLIFEVELINIVQNMEPAHQFDKYFAENHINAQKTAEGLYYVITEKGTGDAPKQGQTVIANYRGKLLNGTTFDSNMDAEFKHVSPFSFALGQHMVIQGWDIGFSLLNKGSKATLYIPSNLGYGEQAQGPIPANAPLIFDVELVDIK